MVIGRLPGKNKVETKSQTLEVIVIEEGVGTYAVVDAINDIWLKICTQRGFAREGDTNNIVNKTLNFISYCSIELGKNVLEYGNGGEVQIIVNHEEVTVVATDYGLGIENPDSVIMEMPNHGLSEVVTFADAFTLETKGKKFTKTKDGGLTNSGNSDIKRGTKITFIKKFSLQ